MHIEFVRSGGFANIPLQCALDTETLSSEQRRELEGKVEDANFFALPATLRADSVAADVLQYRVTVETGGRSHTIDVSGGAGPEALRQLLDALTRMARASRRAAAAARRGDASA